jgi:hypothetical protein
MDLQKWWLDVFISVSRVFPLGLVLGAVYLIAADLAREQKCGTLDLLRLSPQSTKEIIGGKILAVPILVYVATVIAVPLHLWAGFNAGGDFLSIGSWYLAIGSLWFLMSGTAALSALLGIPAILTTMVVAYPIWLVINELNYFTSATIARASWLNDKARIAISWFGFPVTSNAIWIDLLFIICCTLTSYIVWQALERRYLVPSATVISKVQSYLFSCYFHIIIAGFVIPFVLGVSNYQLRPWTKSFFTWKVVSTFLILDLLALLISIPMLLPSKQAMQDWSRYCGDRDLIKDLIIDDRSPALLAIAINVGMAVVLWAPISIIYYYSLSPDFQEFTTLLSCVLLVAIALLIYAAIAHLCLFINSRKRGVMTIGIIASMAILPLSIPNVLFSNRIPAGLSAILFLLSPLATVVAPLKVIHIAAEIFLVPIIIQLGILAVLTWQLYRKLRSTDRIVVSGINNPTIDRR